MFRKGSKPGRTTRCTKCGRPRRGHEGPCGVRCSMTESVQDNNSENEWQDENVVTRADSPTLMLDAQSPFVKELARQMSELTMNVSRILAKQPPNQTTGHSTQPQPTNNAPRHATPDAAPSLTSTGNCLGACCTAGTNEPPVALTNGARVSRKTINNAKAGEFTN